MSDRVTDNALPVEAWFGPRFAELHPRLRELHAAGGSLTGTAMVRVGSGLAGWIGRRLARRLGVQPGGIPLRIDIRNDRHGLHWTRRFGNGAFVTSVFRPVGTIAEGWWTERSGAIELRLGVDIVDGGWMWRQRGSRLWGLPWPGPRVRAGKRIIGDEYVFDVAIALPLVGEVLAYEGRLRGHDSVSARVDAASPAKKKRAARGGPFQEKHRA
jgi:hypothetical protein